jgi:hypothetical protein
MYLDILNLLNQDNRYGLIIILTFVFIILILFHLYKTYFVVQEPFFKKIGRAVSRAASSVDPTKLIKEALGKVEKGFLELLGKFSKPFTDFFDSINKKFKKISEFIKSIPDTLEDVANDVKEELNKALNDMKKIIMKPMDGIDEMISDFKKLMCLFESFPNRIANAISGVDLIFQGIGEQYNLIMKAAGRGFDETSTLTNYSIVFFNSYLKCFMKFLLNMYKCFFFYMVDAIGKFIYLPIRIIMWFLKVSLGFDLYPTEKKIWNGIEYIDSIIFSTFQFHIIHFPKSIRDDCYTCIRLRKEVVNRQGRKVDHTFNVEIPEIINEGIKNKVGIAKMRKGARHFDEVVAMPRAQPPKRVE